MEVEREEEECMQKNAWTVCHDVCCRIHMEPGPAGDNMLSHVTPQKPFFYNAKYLNDYHKASKGKRSCLPGAAYFSKIEVYFKEHVERGELFMEIRSCRDCQTCKELPVHPVHRCPFPFPDYSKLPQHHYVPLCDTPHECDGVTRKVDDFLPRAQIKALFISNEFTSSDADKIKAFCQKYIVREAYVKTYLQHMEALSLKKIKRKDQRNKADMPEQREEDSNTNNDNDSRELLSDSSTSDNNDSEDDIILAVVGNESSEASIEDSSEHSSEESSSEVEANSVSAPMSRSGRLYTTLRSRRFFGDSD